MARVLVTETLPERALAILREAGHEVDVRLGLSVDDLHAALPGAEALLIRSATKIRGAELAAATELFAVGRAGIGVDNVDVDEATRRGVMVINAPGSNALSTAEHAMALLLAQARNIPQAHSALKDGRWEKSKWEGVELHGKVLGVVGMGRIGTLVAQRAHAFGMQIVAWDPWVTKERARGLGIELFETLEELVAVADFVSIHLVKVPEYEGLFGKELFAKAKPGIRIINDARGGLIDEEALAEAIRSGQVHGAALDVFNVEPTTESPLFDLDSVVVTPHLAASTPEAQDKAGIIVAEQIVLALAGEFVPFAVNVEATEATETVRPYLPLAEQLGRMFASLVGSLPSLLEVEYQGGLAEHDTRVLTLSVLKGLFAGSGHADHVSYVNVRTFAEERGLEIRESKTSAAQDYVNLVTLRGGGHAIAGTLAGVRGEPRIVMVDDHSVDVPPSHHMLIVRNDDRPGIIGLVGTILGDNGINIADMALGRSPAGETALILLATDQECPTAVIEQLTASAGILDVHSVDD